MLRRRERARRRPRATSGPEGREAGFTLIEILVALAVAAISLAAVGLLFAANMRTTRQLEDRLALAEAARTLMTALPDRSQMAAGELAGEIGVNRWRLDVVPFLAGFIDARAPSPWLPQTVVLSVQSPTGRTIRLETVTLRPRPRANQ